VVKLKNAIKKDHMVFNMIAYPVITILSLICLIPFIIIVSSSLTQEQSIIANGYNFIPKVFSIEAYKTLFAYPGDIIRAYGITILVTLLGTLIGLFLTAMTAFVLSVKSFPWANRFSFFFYFTTLFSGGLVPWYILCVQYLHFKTYPIMAMILPYLFNIFYLIIMKTFIKTTIPEAIIESARIDGAGYFRIFIQLILPLTKSALATIGLFIALVYWNDWYLSYLFVAKSKYYSLQFFLYRMISMEDAISKLAAAKNVSMPDMPKEGIRMAMTVIATGPILLLYPFVQKYFVKGLTIGAVKG